MSKNRKKPGRHRLKPMLPLTLKLAVVAALALYCLSAAGYFAPLSSQAFETSMATAMGVPTEPVKTESVTAPSANQVEPARQAPAAPAPAEAAPAAPAPAEAAPPANPYTIRSGDTLSEIASAHGTTWQKLFEQNRTRLSDPDIVRVGHVIDLPPGAKPKPPAEAPAEAASAASAPTAKWVHPFPDFNRCSSFFGKRKSPDPNDNQSTENHGGVDLSNQKAGSKIHAIGAGTVTRAGKSNGYGNVVVIRHDNGLFSWYGHVPRKSIQVKEGERVAAGQHIANVGNEGRSFGAHLHLGLGPKPFEEPIDPQAFLEEQGVPLCDPSKVSPPAPEPDPEPASAASTSNDDGEPDNSVWDKLADCESGGDWSINTGNGYYGGIQFSLDSWRAVGGSGYPHEASKAEQIKRGEMLQDLQGWGAWPACSDKLGLDKQSQSD